MTAMVASSEDLEQLKNDMEQNENGEKLEMKETTPQANGGDVAKDPASTESPPEVETKEAEGTEAAEKEGKATDKKIARLRGFFSRDRSHSGDRKEDAAKEVEKKPSTEGTEGEGDPETPKDEATELLIAKEGKEMPEVAVEQPKKSKKLHLKPVKWPKIGEKKAKADKVAPVENDTQPLAEEDPKEADKLNMENRDNKSINTEIELGFEDVFGEPADQHSVNCNWRAAHCIFTKGRSIIYKVLTFLFAIPCALLWAIVFALLSCFQVWACVPALKAGKIFLSWPFKVYAFLARSIFDPLFISCGQCLGNIKVRQERYDNNPSSTMEMAPVPVVVEMA